MWPFFLFFFPGNVIPLDKTEPVELQRGWTCDWNSSTGRQTYWVLPTTTRHPHLHLFPPPALEFPSLKSQRPGGRSKEIQTIPHLLLVFQRRIELSSPHLLTGTPPCSPQKTVPDVSRWWALGWFLSPPVNRKLIACVKSSDLFTEVKMSPSLCWVMALVPLSLSHPHPPSHQVPALKAELQD